MVVSYNDTLCSANALHSVITLNEKDVELNIYAYYEGVRCICNSKSDTALVYSRWPELSWQCLFALKMSLRSICVEL